MAAKKKARPKLQIFEGEEYRTLGVGEFAEREYIILTEEFIPYADLADMLMARNKVDGWN